MKPTMLKHQTERIVDETKGREVNIIVQMESGIVRPSRLRLQASRGGAHNFSSIKSGIQVVGGGKVQIYFAKIHNRLKKPIAALFVLTTVQLGRLDDA